MSPHTRPSVCACATRQPTYCHRDGPVVDSTTSVGDDMAPPKLSKLELKIMEALWIKGPSSVREIQETFPAKRRPAYTTVQTIVYRLEAKNALRRARKIGNAHIFEAVISQAAAQRNLIDELL